MTRRTRALLLDNTGGRMFTNVASSAEATADKVIAGTRPQAKVFTQPAARDVFTQQNLGSTTKGLLLSTRASVISRIDLAVTSAPAGGTGIVVRIRVGATNTSATNAAELTIAPGATSAFQTLNIPVAAGHGVFIDVLSVGTVTKGRGLRVVFTFFSE